MKDLGEKHIHAEGLIDGNRKRIVRLQAQLDALKSGGTLTSAPADQAQVDHGVISSDGGVDAEALEKLEKKI